MEHELSVPDQTRTGATKLARAVLPEFPQPAPHRAPHTDWRRYVTAVVRYKWLVAAVTIVGTLAAGWGANSLQPRYRARSVIWVEVTDPRVREPAVAGGGQLLGATGWVDLLQSHAVLDEVVRREHLYLTPAPGSTAAFATFGIAAQYRPGQYRLEIDKAGTSFTLTTDAGSVMDQGPVGDSVGEAVGFAWVPAPSSLNASQSLQFSVASQYEAARDLARDLRVVTELGGNFLRLELAGTKPERVAATVNAVAQRFIEVASDLKRKKLSELARILGEQLDRARQNLSAAEASLRSFRVQTAPLLLGGGTPGTPGVRSAADPVLTNFIELRGTQAQLVRDRQALERALLTMGDSGLTVDALTFIGSVQSSPELSQALRDVTTKQAELRALRLRYTDELPPVRRVATELESLRRHTLPTGARALVDELAARETELRARLDSASGDLRQIPTLAIEDARLRRDVEIAEQVFTRIQQRQGEAQLAEVSSLPDVRVLDFAAVPERPVGNPAPIVILLGLFGGFGVAVVGAVVLQGLDFRLQDPLQVTEGFGLRILGALPHVAAEGEGAGQAVDALRGIRLNVMHSYGSAGPVVLTVSSPSTGDGKSFVSVNLAQSFADAGFNTLVVDGDTRRGRLQRVLGLHRKPGLIDVLAGAVPIDAALQATSRPRLSFLGCGSRTRSGPELLGSAAMPQLLVNVRERFSVVVFDSPPLAAGIDPFVLGALTGNMLLVLRLGVTDRMLAEGKLEALTGLPIRVLGAVLNDVRSRDVYGRYAYALEGYELRDEESTWAEEKILREPA